MTINVELLSRDAADRVTSVAKELHNNMDDAIRAAKRLAGTRRAMERAGAALRVTGKNGTAWVIR
jgi:hypothetical protein